MKISAMYIHASMHSNFGTMRLFYFCLAFCTVIVPRVVQPKQSGIPGLPCTRTWAIFWKGTCTIPSTPTPSRRPPWSSCQRSSGCGRYRTYIWGGILIWGRILKSYWDKILRFFLLAIHIFSERGWAHPLPSPGWADFSIMIKCTSESGHCHSVYTLWLGTFYSLGVRLDWKTAKKRATLIKKYNWYTVHVLIFRRIGSKSRENNFITPSAMSEFRTKCTLLRSRSHFLELVK